MPTIYIRKDLHDQIIKLGENPTDFVNTLLDKQFVVVYKPLVEKSEQKSIEKSVEKTIQKKVKKDA